MTHDEKIVLLGEELSRLSGEVHALANALVGALSVANADPIAVSVREHLERGYATHLGESINAIATGAYENVMNEVLRALDGGYPAASA